MTAVARHAPEHRVPGSQRLIARSVLGKQLSGLIMLAVLLGGGGVAYALNNLLVQLAALTILAFNRESFFRFWVEAPFVLRTLVGASHLLPLIQLVPLPFDTTTALPGRMHLQETMQALGKEGAFPLSLAPHRTLVAASALIIPLTILTLGWSLERRDIRALMLAAIAAGLIHTAIGFSQVLSGANARLFYPENPMPGVLFGTFANRNSAGLLCVAALCLTAIPHWRGQSRLFLIGTFSAIALLFLAAFLTQSRTAIVLAFVPLGLAAFRIFTDHMASKKRLRMLPMLGIIAIGIAMIAGTAAIFSSSARVETVIERFEKGGGARTYLWEDAFYSAEQYWPTGAGMGAFDEVFQANEALENITVKKAGRAHNDYLELAIEGGIIGIIILIGWFAYIAWSTLIVRHSADRWSAWAGTGVLAVIAAQSVTDYPLRNMAMLGVGALALLLLARFSRERAT